MGSARAAKSGSASVVRGSVTSRNPPCGDPKPYTLYFEMRFSRPATGYGTFTAKEGSTLPGSNLSGRHTVALHPHAGSLLVTARGPLHLRPTVPTGALDITLYRDDLMRHAVGPQPLIRRTEIPFSIDDKKILLVDDVLYTGRTTRAALDALIDFGRPKGIQLIVLVDRGHRELPIKADYVGKNLPTNPEESVQVRLQETDGNDEVVLQQEATV